MPPMSIAWAIQFSIAKAKQSAPRSWMTSTSEPYGLPPAMNSTSWGRNVAARPIAPMNTALALIRFLVMARMVPASRPGFVQGHRGADEGLQRLLVDLVAFVEIDGAPGLPL